MAWPATWTLIGSPQGCFGWATQENDSLDIGRCWLHGAPGSCIGPWTVSSPAFQRASLAAQARTSPKMMGDGWSRDYGRRIILVWR